MMVSTFIIKPLNKHKMLFNISLIKHTYEEMWWCGGVKVLRLTNS